MKTATVRLRDIAFGGDAVGELEGKVIFVPYGIPGELVTVEVTREYARYAVARLVEVLEPSPDRVEPPCPHFGVCGGCQWQHLDHPVQLEWKRRVLEEQLRRVGKLEAVEVRPPLAPLAPWAYRARAQLKVAGRGRPLVGFHQRATNRVVDLDRCPLLEPRLSAVLAALRAMRTPNLLTLFPGLREVWLAAASGTPDVLVSLFARPRERGQARLLFHALRAAAPSLRGVVLLAGEPRGSPRPVDWHGERTLREQVGGHRFRIDATAFFQVSGRAAEALLTLVRDAAGLTGRERVLDLYCGVGTFTLPLAAAAGETVGVEAHPAAAEDAVHNLAESGCRGARVLRGQAEDALPALAAQGPWDLVLLDPPRQGCSPAVLGHLAELAARRILYVSCDPSTLARDLGALAGRGYVIRWVQPVDLFPQTFHLEAVALLEARG